MTNYQEYFNGTKLYGNDFTLEQIKQWYDEEAEGYANLGSKDESSYTYGYHMLNRVHGFQKLGKSHFQHALGFGSAWGYEFEPIAHQIEQLTIIEPSDNMSSNRIGQLTPNYVKPTIEGILPFADQSFDLITCFGTLHHVANVSKVLSELIRVLQPGGYLLIREPIVSMGDWRKPRHGLTKNERGIPTAIFEEAFSKANVKIVSKSHCFSSTSRIQRTLRFFFKKKPLYAYRSYILLDKFISKALAGQVRYHSSKLIHKMAPSSIFYVITRE
jgi:ubiquinone/menaquinone biosynthesis C-methylase UbiE